MNNNIKLQVARQLDENTKLKMKDEFIRLQAEEATRVQAYTKKWESHVDKLTKDKDAERLSQLEEQKKVFEAKIAAEEEKAQEAQALAKKASVAAAMAVAAAETAKVMAKNETAKAVEKAKVDLARAEKQAKEE